VQKDRVISVFFCFWDLHAQKLVVKRWLNLPLLFKIWTLNIPKEDWRTLKGSKGTAGCHQILNMGFSMSTITLFVNVKSGLDFQDFIRDKIVGRNQRESRGIVSTSQNYTSLLFVRFRIENSLEIIPREPKVLFNCSKSNILIRQKKCWVILFVRISSKRWLIRWNIFGRQQIGLLPYHGQ